MEEYYDQETLTKVQHVQAEILRDVLNLCDKYKIDTFLVFGSALGVVRHQGFIPWDDDIDIAMFREDLVRFKEIARKELGGKYEFLTCESNPNYALAHFNLARAISIIGDMVEAAKFYQMAQDFNKISLEIDPRDIADKISELFES